MTKTVAKIMSEELSMYSKQHDVVIDLFQVKFGCQGLKFTCSFLNTRIAGPAEPVRLVRPGPTFELGRTYIFFNLKKHCEIFQNQKCIQKLGNFYGGL